MTSYVFPVVHVLDCMGAVVRCADRMAKEGRPVTPMKPGPGSLQSYERLYTMVRDYEGFGRPGASLGHDDYTRALVSHAVAGLCAVGFDFVHPAAPLRSESAAMPVLGAFMAQFMGMMGGKR